MRRVTFSLTLLVACLYLVACSSQRPAAVTAAMPVFPPWQQPAKILLPTDYKLWPSQDIEKALPDKNKTLFVTMYKKFPDVVEEHTWGKEQKPHTIFWAHVEDGSVIEYVFQPKGNTYELVRSFAIIGGFNPKK